MSEWARELAAVGAIRWSVIPDTGFAESAPLGHAPVVLGLPFGLCFFLPHVLVGGEADDGPNVKDFVKEEARTEPSPERECGCWSGEVAIETL